MRLLLRASSSYYNVRARRLHVIDQSAGPETARVPAAPLQSTHLQSWGGDMCLSLFVQPCTVYRRLPYPSPFKVLLLLLLPPCLPASLPVGMQMATVATVIATVIVTVAAAVASQSSHFTQYT